MLQDGIAKFAGDFYTCFFVITSYSIHYTKLYDKLKTETTVFDLSAQALNYNLPDERIAKYPLPQRDQSKLLVWNSGNITDAQFRTLPDFLPEDSLLIFNNTKVIRARLLFQKATGANIEIFCRNNFV